ncbi:MAG: exodeoxyribonuclease VII large subunit [Spirochaetota bacterium]
MNGKETRVLSVSELTSLVKGLLEDAFPSVTVEGEISNWKPASSGHWYFNLKDRGAMVQAVMFRGRSRSVAFEPHDGSLVRATGQVSVYPARGQYQIIIERMEAAGVGDILAMLEARKRALAAEGLFDADRKRELPRFPQRVVVITSPTGAAIHDILNVLGRRNAGIDIIVLPAAVQGGSAPAELIRQIETANRFKLGDVIILGRGGGSLEDLLAFSDEGLVRAVAASELPVISAVGHEVDTALTDWAADLRAATPSAAAELVSESRQALLAEVAQLKGEFETILSSRIEEVRATLARFEPDAVEGRLMRIMHPMLRSLDEARDALVSGMRERLTGSRHRLTLARGLIEATSPEAILSRGFSIVTRADGSVLRKAGGLGIDDALSIRFAQGRADVRVEGVTP